jgi:predicted nucleotidyltransferase
MDTPEELLATRPESILFECIAGSRAYGTANANSDEDTRGIFAVAARDYLNLERPADQVSDARGNVVYYSLRRVIELLTQANPNILELLFMPDDCVLKTSPEMQQLIAARDIFISKQCADTHAGYAMSQIKKARGQNKWINNPKPPEPGPHARSHCAPSVGISANITQPGWNMPEIRIASITTVPARRECSEGT